MRHRTLVPILLLFTAAAPVRAEVIALDFYQRVPYADGKAFGDVGPYEMMLGVVRYAIDPKDERNRRIIDLDLAKTNKDGKVEFAADICILAPKNPSKGNGAIFYDVNNRGNKLALRMFNFAPGGNDLTKAGSEGDGFLMRRGYTIVWSGWIGELLVGDHRLLLEPPAALQDGKELRGLVRFEMGADKAIQSLPLSRREGHGSYRPAKEALAKAVLTMRKLEQDKFEIVPGDQWCIKSTPSTPPDKGVHGSLNLLRLELESGFQPGVIYEVVCDCEGSLVMGTGFAAVRDLISFFKQDGSDQNPLRTKDGKPSCNRALSFGVSQSGRFLRHMLWQGFNEDEQGRIVFDGLMPHVAGGGLGSFNHRFAQPTRHNGQHEEHTYPGDMFPFTYGEETDPFTKRKDGILSVYAKSKMQPKIMHTQSAAEYWHRSGSLVHTDPLGTKDAVIPDNVRIYAFGGTQHGPASDPPKPGIGQNLPNPADYRPHLRALLDHLDAWVKDGKQPLASVYPRIEKKELVNWRQESTQFPKIPGVRYPQVIQQPAYCNYGPDFLTKGIITKEPPDVLGRYTVLVAKSDIDGMDLGCMLPAEVSVPLATYTGWNLRNKGAGAENMLASLMGSYLPFAKTKADRIKTSDPRASIEERFGTYAEYVNQFERWCKNLVARGEILQEDANRLIRSRAKVRELFAN